MRAHQHEEVVCQRGEHLRLRAWSDDEIADCKVRLEAFEGAHVFFGGEGVEEDEEEEGEATEDGDVELSIPLDVDPAPRPKSVGALPLP